MPYNLLLQKTKHIFRKAPGILAALRHAWREADDIAHYRSIENFLQATSSIAVGDNTSTSTCTLDLGCGHTPRNPFKAEQCYGIDIRAVASESLLAVQEANLAIEPIPYKNNSVNFITAYDFLEHVPRVLLVDGKIRFCFVELMNEIHRVLRPQGIFLSFTPAVPFHSAFTDPTHVNFITSSTFPLYFSNNLNGFPWAVSYGFTGGFNCIAQGWVGGHLASLLQKPR
jgi:SAM-dependent methyltransferase